MTKRLSAISVAIWALVMLPALCMGGFIGHSCDCADEESCRHEVGCDDDPCSQLSAAPRPRCDTSDVVARDTGVAACVAALVHSLDLLDRAWEAPPPFPVYLRLPFAPSDAPLLL